MSDLPTTGKRALSVDEREGEPTQPTIRRIRRYGVRPDRDLGQSFLIDSNIIRVVAAAANLNAADVVLEIGGGLGTLSEHLAPQVAHLHVVEIDRRLEEPLTEALAPFGNVALHWGDAMRIDLAALRPTPSKLVANLPYGIAAGVLLRTVQDLVQMRCWVAMVQREVGERLAAPPGSGLYGISSVIAQSSCEVHIIRPISRTVFHPVPNVDSVLVSMVRAGPAASPALSKLVRAAFAHRRKSLSKSVSIASGDDPRLVRENLAKALAQLRLPHDVRAERLTPAQFCRLAHLLTDEGAAEE